jgi:hypothetical protein
VSPQFNLKLTRRHDTREGFRGGQWPFGSSPMLAPETLQDSPHAGLKLGAKFLNGASPFHSWHVALRLRSSSSPTRNMSASRSQGSASSSFFSRSYSASNFAMSHSDTGRPSSRRVGVARYRGENVIRCFGPGEGLRRLIVYFQIFPNRSLQFFYAGKDSTPNSLIGDIVPPG